MSLPNDLLFGRIAVEQGFVTESDVEECLAEQAAGTDPRPLGELLLERGTITKRQMETIAAIQQQRMGEEDPLTRRRREDSLFGRLAWRMGMIRQIDLNFAVRQQAEHTKRGTYVPLGTLLVREGYLTEEQVQSVLEVQRKAILYCEQCKVLYTIKGLAGKDVLSWLNTLRCPRCKEDLIEPGDEVPAEAEWVVLPLEGLPIRAPSTSSPTPPATQHPTRPIVTEPGRKPAEAAPTPVRRGKNEETTYERKGPADGAGKAGAGVAPGDAGAGGAVEKAGAGKAAMGGAPEKTGAGEGAAKAGAGEGAAKAGQSGAAAGPEAAASAATGAKAEGDAVAAGEGGEVPAEAAIEGEEAIPANVPHGPVACTCPVCEGGFEMEPDKFGRVKCAACRVWFLAV